MDITDFFLPIYTAVVKIFLEGGQNNFLLFIIIIFIIIFIYM